MIGKRLMHRCKWWAWMKGPCPLGTEVEHEPGRENEDYEEAKFREVRAGAWNPTFVRASQLESAALAYEFAKEVGKRWENPQQGPVPAPAQGTTEPGGIMRPEVLGPALVAALTVGATVLLGHGFKRSLPVGLNLEGQLSSLLRTRSGTRARGGSAGQGFRVNWTAKLAALAK